jgi:hypothetical protein
MITKKLAGKYSRPDDRSKTSKDRPSLTEQQLERWAEHFEELLNRPAPENPPNTAEADTNIEINCNPPKKRRDHPRHHE